MTPGLTRRSAAAAMAASLAAAGVASAAPAAAPPMPLGQAAETPAGFLDFCRRQPQDCGGDAQAIHDRLAALGADHPWRARFAAARAPAPGALRDPDAAWTTRLADPEAAAPLTSTLWSQAVRVNADVNRAIIRRSDQANYGVEDRWATPLEAGSRYGDCEDYVLEKRRALLAAGVPAKALHIALVTTRWGEAHAVLLLTTDRGEYVLDNLSPWIVAWNQAPYRWRTRQVGADPFAWVAVDTPIRVAARSY
jgi:predicted transglutaminase-like cysteine proteinase